MARHALLAWTDDALKPAADLAYAGNGEAACGSWCGFCKAKATCRTRAKANLELAKHEFRVPPLIEDTDVEEILDKLYHLVAWASDIKDYALKQALSGKRWAGFKLVEGRFNRRYVDEEAVAEAVEAAGFEPFESRLLGITSIQRMLGKPASTSCSAPWWKSHRTGRRSSLKATNARLWAMQRQISTTRKKVTTMTKTTPKNPMKVITGADTRWNYANVWKPKSINSGTPKYSVSLIIPKSDTATISKTNEAIEAAYTEGQAKLKGSSKTVPLLFSIKTPLHDGDVEHPNDPAYANVYFINANSATAPGIVDSNLNPVINRSEVYSGVYGRASINLYAFNTNGNRGIACGLNNLQLIRPGEPLGGKASPETDFAFEDDDFLS